MLYVFVCKDKENATELRQATRPDHLEYVGQHNIQSGGPLLSDDEATPIGSLIILEAESLAEAQAFAEADPYAKAGLFASVTITPFKKTVG